MVTCPKCGNEIEVRPHYAGGFIAGCWSDDHIELVDDVSDETDLFPMTGTPHETKEGAIESWNEWSQLFNLLETT